MAPGMVPFVTSAFIHWVMRSSRSADKPTSAGLAVGRFCAATVAASARTRTNERDRVLGARMSPSHLGCFSSPRTHLNLKGMMLSGAWESQRENEIVMGGDPYRCREGTKRRAAGHARRQTPADGDARDRGGGLQEGDNQAGRLAAAAPGRSSCQ